VLLLALLLLALLLGCGRTGGIVLRSGH